MRSDLIKKCEPCCLVLFERGAWRKRMSRMGEKGSKNRILKSNRQQRNYRRKNIHNARLNSLPQQKKEKPNGREREREKTNKLKFMPPQKPTKMRRSNRVMWRQFVKVFTKHFENGTQVYFHRFGCSVLVFLSLCGRSYVQLLIVMRWDYFAH